MSQAAIYYMVLEFKHTSLFPAKKYLSMVLKMIHYNLKLEYFFKFCCLLLKIEHMYWILDNLKRIQALQNKRKFK